MNDLLVGKTLLQNKTRSSRGFTIVELLIVVVVIAILAAITIVAFNGIQDRARLSAVQSDIASIAKKLEIYKNSPENNVYPASLSAASITPSGTASSTLYSSDGSTYCLVGVIKSVSYFSTNTQTTPSQGSCVVKNGLVAWWPLNGTANDQSGNSINGTMTNVTATTGQNSQANGASYFNGTNAYINVGTTSALNTSTFSVSVWVNLDANIGTNTWNDILAGPASDWGVGVNVVANGSGYLRATKVGIVDAAAMAVPVLTKQAWQHLVLTMSQTGSNAPVVTYYLNGQPAGLTYLSQQVAAYGAKTIGARQNGSSGFFHGAMDDLRVYNRVLSADEATAIFNGGAQQ